LNIMTEGEDTLSLGYYDLVAFGRILIINKNIPPRLKGNGFNYSEYFYQL
jgi:hypothetical protein